MNKTETHQKEKNRQTILLVLTIIFSIIGIALVSKNRKEKSETVKEHQTNITACAQNIIELNKLYIQYINKNNIKEGDKINNLLINLENFNLEHNLGVDIKTFCPNTLVHYNSLDTAVDLEKTPVVECSNPYHNTITIKK